MANFILSFYTQNFWRTLGGKRVERGSICLRYIFLRLSRRDIDKSERVNCRAVFALKLNFLRLFDGNLETCQFSVFLRLFWNFQRSQSTKTKMNSSLACFQTASRRSSTASGVCSITHASQTSPSTKKQTNSSRRGTLPKTKNFLFLTLSRPRNLIAKAPKNVPATKEVTENSRALSRKSNARQFFHDSSI